MSHSYFQSYLEYFWEWEKYGEVVAVLPGGNSIAYKEFLFEVVDKLAPQGLPPFGSLLLAVAATNPKGTVSADYIHELITKKIDRVDDHTLGTAIGFLKILVTLPAQYKSQEKRIMLLQTIFEGCHNRLSLKDSQKIAADCKAGTLNFDRATTPQDFMMGVFRNDFRPVALLANKYQNAEAIIGKIGALPDQPQIEFDFEAPAKSDVPIGLVDELIANDKTFPAGSLIRWLWGGLNIPVHSALPSQQPMGGISDLTNKGDFDKLLVSEFAYDDITFLSRLANNEALYIHREIPPASNDLHRIILIDASLKNWGTPKTIAFAVMLAIARHPKTDIECQGYVLGSERYYPVSTESIHTIIDALQIVEGSLHAAEGLALFLKDHGADRNKEIFFITEATTLKHAPLLRVMNAHQHLINYLVLTDVEGNVDIYKKHQHTRKHLQHIKLPLEQLWKKSKPEQVAERRVPSSVVKLPLLLKEPGRAKRIVSAPDGEIFRLNDEHAILKTFDKTVKNKGWELIYEGLPFKTNTFEMGMSGKGEYVALLYNPPPREILLLNLSTGEKTTVAFPDWRSTAWPSFVFDSGKFYHLNGTGGWSISLMGDVTKSNYLQHKKFTDRETELKEIVSKYVSVGTVFKNINKVFINKPGQLIFNIHTLALNGEHLKLGPAADLTAYIASENINTGQFRFPDGSVVDVSRSGYLILKSSDPSLSPIYVPTSLDGTLGIATETEFAGNEFFFKEPLVELNLENAGPEKLKVTKIVTTELGFSLSQAKQIVDGAPRKIPGKCTQARASQIKNALETGHATVTVQAITDEALPAKISASSFYKRFINHFVNTIVNHGA